MSIIKIIANGFELDFVKETLSIKKENNSLINDFKVNYSSIPFLVIENSTTKKALGTRDLTSINKQKKIEVTVIEAGTYYYGELQVLTYLNGFRKCNLKYATELLKIMNKKISEFMPVISVIPGETNPVPYTEESNEVIPGYINWETFPISFLANHFPTVKFQFPTMNWRNKFGIDLDPTDKWYNYQNVINGFNEELTELITNNYSYDGSGNIIIDNKNVVSPQIFLLAPLFYALESIDFKFHGNFTTSNFINRLLFLSDKTNLTEVNLLGIENDISFAGIDWDLIGTGFPFYQKVKSFYVTAPGTYRVNYSFTYNVPYSGGFPSDKLILGYPDSQQTLFSFMNIPSTGTTFQGSVEVQASAVGYFVFILISNESLMPNSYSLTLQKVEEKTFVEMHPTIELGRYLPDWTFATYLNELKNFLNLDIASNDETKILTLNFNENAIINAEKEVITKSLSIDYYEPTPYEAFLLKYANDEDAALWITKEGAEIFTDQKSDFLNTISSKFKLVTVNNTADLSEELISKDGVGLMIYDEERKPFVSTNYNFQTLSIDGDNGIYQKYHKVFIKFRLNSSLLEMTGPFSEVELSKIIKKNRIYIDHQEYAVVFLEYEETQTSLFKVKFRLESINY